jgi:hypothetical protein
MLKQRKTMEMMNKIKYLSFVALALIFVAGCDKPITEFGFDGSISGTIKDAAGNIVPGDITTSNFIVRVLADGDISTIDMRVKGDGTFMNDKLYPVNSKVWISGPVVPAATDTVMLDLSGGQQVVHDFVVTPVFSIATPVISGTPTATTASFTYNITANSSKTPSAREIYCSTIPYPNTSTGSGPYYSTVKKTMTTNSGTVDLTGLKASTLYYVRIGVRSSTTQFNFSDQITFTTPAAK